MLIRPEIPEDIPAIASLTKAAFAPVPYSDGSEPAIVDTLRQQGDLTLSLVAETKSQIVGHVAFSPVTIGHTKGNWFGLGPISVAPERQRQGVGRQLIEAGHKTLIGQGAEGCVLIGDPGYYSQHGYTGDGSISYQGLDQNIVQWISFNGTTPAGEITYARAFTAL